MDSSSAASPLRPEHERRHPPFDNPLDAVLFWVQVVTRPVADYGPANDEPVRVEARELYNLMQALEAYDRGR
jgi:hypothetical protein